MKKFMVIIAVIAMVGAFAATSMAAEWNFYGSSRMTTVYYDKDKALTPAGTFDDQDTTWNSQTNSRFGAKVKASDAVSGRFEFAMGQDAGLRLMYGTYNFGSGTLLVGQDYTPTTSILSANIGVLPSKLLDTNAAPADGEGNALQIGAFYESRQPQIALKFGGLTLAFVKPVATTIGAYTDPDTTIPKIEASYNLKFDNFHIKPYAGYNTAEMADTATDNSITVSSYVLGASFGVNFGPMFVKGQAFWMQNPDNFGRSNVGLYDGAVLNAAGTDVEDSTGYGGQIIVGFKMSDMVTFEAGYSYDHNEIDLPTGLTGENDPSAWYVDATITLAPGVFIVPEVGMYDFGDNDTGAGSTDRGDCIYYGAKWQINF